MSPHPSESLVLSNLFKFVFRIATFYRYVGGMLQPGHKLAVFHFRSLWYEYTAMLFCELQCFCFFNIWWDWTWDWLVGDTTRTLAATRLSYRAAYPYRLGKHVLSTDHPSPILPVSSFKKNRLKIRTTPLLTTTVVPAEYNSTT